MLQTNDIYLVRRTSEGTFEELTESPFSYNAELATDSPNEANNELNIKTKLRVASLTVEGTTTIVDQNTQTSEQLLITNDGAKTAAIITQTGSGDVLDIQAGGTCSIGGRTGQAACETGTDPASLTGAGETDRGVYSSNEDYADGDQVSHNNKAWEKTGAQSSSEHSEPGTESSEWLDISVGTWTVGVHALYVRYDSDKEGFVGLGTTEPEAQLHLTGDIRLGNTKGIYLDDATAGENVPKKALYVGSDGVLNLSNDTSKGINFTTGEADAVLSARIDEAGNMLLGPGRFAATHKSAANLEIIRDGYPNLILGNKNSTIIGELNVDHTAIVTGGDNGATSTTGALVLGTSDPGGPLVLKTNNKEYIVLSEDGEVTMRKRTGKPNSGNLTVEGELFLPNATTFAIGAEEILFTDTLTSSGANQADSFKFLEFTYPTGGSDNGSPFIIEIWSEYGSAAGYQKYLVCHADLDSGQTDGVPDAEGGRDYQLKILESANVQADAHFRLRMGAPTDQGSNVTGGAGVNSDIAVVGVSAELRHHAQARVKVTSLASNKSNRIDSSGTWAIGDSNEYRFYKDPQAVDTDSTWADYPFVPSNLDAVYAEAFYGSRIVNDIGTDTDPTTYFLKPADTGTSMAVAGNVGIGVDSPAAKLHVNGPGDVAMYITSENNWDNTWLPEYPSSSTALWFAHGWANRWRSITNHEDTLTDEEYNTYSATEAEADQWGYWQGSFELIPDPAPTPDFAGIVFDADNNLRVTNSGDNNGQGLVISEEGNVGIGSNPDSAILHDGVVTGFKLIVGQAIDKMTLPNSTSNWARGAISITDDGAPHPDVATADNPGGSWYGGIHSIALNFGLNNLNSNGDYSEADLAGWIQATNPANNSESYPLLLNPNGGNVGIGTSSPAGALHIVNPSANTLTLTRQINILGIADGAVAKIEGGALSAASPSMGAALGFSLVDVDGDGGGPGNTKGHLYFETKDSGSSLTEKMRITSDGNVGIGTDAPHSNLTVASTYTAQLSLTSKDTSIEYGQEIGAILGEGYDSNTLDAGNALTNTPFTGAKIAFRAGAKAITGVNVDWDTNTPNYWPTSIDFYTQAATDNDDIAAGPRMTIASDGNVGIGTDSPIGVLHVQPTSDRPFTVSTTGFVGIGVAQGGASAGSDLSQYHLELASHSLGGPTLGLHNYRNDLTEMGKINFLAGNSAGTVAAQIIGSRDVGDGVGSSLRFGTKPATVDPVQERMIIDSSGNVGIGTGSPMSKLDIKTGGNAGQGITFSYSNAAHSHHCIGVGHANYGNQSDSNYMAFNVWDSRGSVHSDGTTDLNGTAAGLTEVMRINGVGNVGIGTDSPGQKLHIKETATVGHGISLENDGGIVRQILGTASDANHPSLRIKSDSTTLMTLMDSGNVGIGNTNAASKLSLHGPTDNDASGYENRLAFYQHADGTRFRGIGMFHNGEYATPTDFGVGIWAGAGAGTAPTSANPKFVVTDGGNVGIGTTSPKCHLDSVGTIRAIKGTQIPPTSGFGMEMFHDNNRGYIFAYDRDNGVYGPCRLGSSLYVLPNGNVGIDKATPAGALDMGSGTAGRSIVWGGSTGSSYHYSSIGTTYSSGDLYLGNGFKAKTDEDGFEYSYGDDGPITHGTVGMKFDYSLGITYFYNKGPEVITNGADFDTTGHVSMALYPDRVEIGGEEVLTSPAKYEYEDGDVDNIDSENFLINTDIAGIVIDGIYELYAKINPNEDGSPQLYSDLIYGKIIISTSGTTGDRKRHVNYVRENPQPRDLDESGSLLNHDITAVLVTGNTTEQPNGVSAGSNSELRLSFNSDAHTKAGSNIGWFEMKIRKII